MRSRNGKSKIVLVRFKLVPEKGKKLSEYEILEKSRGKLSISDFIRSKVLK